MPDPCPTCRQLRQRNRELAAALAGLQQIITQARLPFWLFLYQELRVTLTKHPRPTPPPHAQKN